MGNLNGHRYAVGHSAFDLYAALFPCFKVKYGKIRTRVFDFRFSSEMCIIILILIVIACNRGSIVVKTDCSEKVQGFKFKPRLNIHKDQIKEGSLCTLAIKGSYLRGFSVFQCKLKVE